MSRYALALCVAVVLGASSARAAAQSDVLVPEGEDTSILEEARWAFMDKVNAVAFSPDGRLVASGGDDNLVRLWEVSTGREVRRLEGHTDAVVSLAFSRDGLTLASGAKDTTVQLWEVGTGRALHSLRGHRELVRSLAFDTQGEFLASGSGDKTVKLWNVSSGKLLDSLEGPAEPILAFTPSGKLLVSGGGGATVEQWAVGTEQRPESPQAFAKASSSGSPSALVSPEFPRDAPLPLREPGTGRALQQEKDVQDPILVYSPDGRLLASGGSDTTVRLRDARSKLVLHELKGHLAPAQSLAFSSDGRMLASGGGDNTVRLWDVATGRELRLLQGNQYPVSSVAFTQQGRTLVSAGSDAVIHLWDLNQGREQQRWETQASAVSSVAVSANGTFMAAAGKDGSVYLWEPATSHVPRKLTGHLGPVYCVAFNPDGSLLASGSKDGTVRLWKTSNGDTLKTWTWHTGPVRALAFSPTEEVLASGGDDGNVFLTSVREDLSYRLDPSVRGQLSPGHVLSFGLNVPLATYNGPSPHEGPVYALAFRGDGQLLASGGKDATIRLWELQTLTLVQPVRGQTRIHAASLKKLLKDPKLSKAVWSLAFSPDKRTLALGGEKMLQLWNLSTGRPSRELESATGWVNSLAFSEDGLSLASGDESGGVRLWAPQEDPPLRGELRGARQGWLSHLQGKPIYRHDDGSFLFRQSENDSLEPIRPTKPEPAPRLSLASHELRTPPGDFGEPGELILTLSNAPDAGRAYWVRVEPVELPPGLILVPPDTVLRLEPGSSAELRVVLSYLRPKDAGIPQDPKAQLRIIHAFEEGPTEGPTEGLTVELPLELRTPQLELIEGPHVEDKTLSVTLKNTGTQPIGPLLFKGDFQAGETKQSGPQQEFSIEPGQEQSLKFSVPPPFLKAGKFAFALSANYEKWPRTWIFPSSEVKVPILYGLYIALGLGALLLYAAVHYARVYRNPMVVHAQKSPTAIKSYSFEHMIAADHALRRAKRRDSTITAAGIPVTRWERALCGAKTPRDAATAFAESIGGRLGASLTPTSWALSLPPLRLRFARDSAVVVIDGTRLESGDAERLMADVFQEGRGPGQVLVLDRTQAQNARQVLEGVPRVRSVVFSTYRLRDLLLADEPVRLLETTISEQVAVSELSPYQVAGGVKLENLFFGREREVRAIADRAVRNFLVVGQRQMGKSSLLLAVLRRLQARSDLDACYVELADGDLHRRLARERERGPADGAPLPPFEEVAAGVPSRPRVWLIDEADDFISADAKAGYPVLQAMRALAEEGRAYFILAGFWDLYRAVVLDEKQPLRNFGEHLRLEPLDQRSALALVTEPMTALSLQWDAPSTPEFLVEQAGRRANMLVLVCKALVESLPPETHVLTREHLERSFREDKDLRDQGRRWRGDHPLHRAVVRQALLLGKPTREEVREALKTRGADIRSVDFDEAMDHRELSYVLVPDGDGRLYCPVPLMQRYIESERSLEVGLAEDLEDLRRRGLAEVPKPA